MWTSLRHFRIVLGVVIIIVVVLGVYAASIISSTQTASTTTVSSGPPAPSTLAIDDAIWPSADLSVASPSWGIYNWPDWSLFTVYQPIDFMNVTAEYTNGIIQYTPGLAYNWTVSPDFTTWTFNLRHVSYSNGDPFNAYEAWFAYYTQYYLWGNDTTWMGTGMTVFDYSNVKFGADLVNMITQSGGLNNPSAQVLAIMSDKTWPFYVTGPYQIVFQLSTPCSFFLDYLETYGIADYQWVLEHGGIGTPTSPNPYLVSHSAPGTGPYVISGFSEKAWISYSQNPNYWGKNLTSAEIQANPLVDPGHVKNVVINYKTDDLARFTDLSTGAVQIAAILSGDWPAITTNPGKYSYVVLPPGADFLEFGFDLNVNLYPTNITDVRQAIVHSINYTDWIQKVMLGYGTQFVGPEWPAFPQYYDLGNFSNYNYNVTLAEQYLAKAHITNMPTLTIRTIAGCPYCDTAAEVIQGYLSAIGIPSTISIVEQSDYFAPYGNTETIIQNAAQLGHISFLDGLSNANPGLNPFDNWNAYYTNRSGFGNWAGYWNPVVQACPDAMLTTDTVAQIQAICAKAQARAYNDAPYVFFSAKLFWVAGSVVWLTQGPIKSFDMDPVVSCDTSTAIFNTVTFKSSSSSQSQEILPTTLPAGASGLFLMASIYNEHKKLDTSA